MKPRLLLVTFLLLASFLFLPKNVFAASGLDFPLGAPNGDGNGVESGGGLTFLEQYDYQGDGISEYHPGEDWNKIGCASCDYGNPVYAAAEGRVLYAKYHSAGWGNLVLVEHIVGDTKIWTQYAHMEALSPKIMVGQTIARGTVIGFVGDFPHGSGRSVHLHFEVRKQYQDAYDFVYNWPKSKVESYYYAPTDFINSHRPAKSSVLTATPGEAQANLSWTKSDDPQFDHYEIYRSSVSGGTLDSNNRTLVLSTKEAGTLSVIDDKVPIGVSYYRIFSFFKNGLTAESSEASVEVKRQITQVTTSTGYQGSPVVVGGKVYYEDTNPSGGTYNKSLYAYDLGTKGTSSLSLPFGTTYAYQPQGASSKIAYYTPDRYGCNRVYYADTSGSQSFPVSIGDGSCSQLNPDINSNDVVVWQQKGLDRLYKIYVNDTSGANGANLLSNFASDQINPRISGSNIIWKDSRSSKSYDIYLRNISNGSETKLVSDTGDGTADIWDNFVAWEYKGKVTLANVETKEQKIITPSGGGYNPTVNEGKVAYTLLEGAKSYVHVYDIQTGLDIKIDFQLHQMSYPSYGNGYIVWDDNIGTITGNKDIFLTKV